MIKEIWMPVLGYEEKYWASNWGRIKSLNYNRTGKEKILRPRKSGGYLHVFLRKNGNGKNLYVARLVWEAFNGPIPEGMQVNHINEDKNNNRLENLNLTTPKENANWGTRNKRMAKSKSKMVEQYTLDGEHIMTWFSVRGVEEELGHFGYNHSAISACCQGKRKMHKGYIWKYKEENSLTDA